MAVAPKMISMKDIVSTAQWFIRTFSDVEADETHFELLSFFVMQNHRLLALLVDKCNATVVLDEFLR